MKKEPLSPEELEQEDAVREMNYLISDAINTAYDIQSTLHDAFDCNKPNKWPEIIDKADSWLSAPIAEMKQKCQKIKRLYGN